MLKPQHKGARGEFAAVIWLLDQGYDVFRNVCPNGPIDLVAIKGPERLLIDVKSNYGAAFNVPFLTTEQAALGVQFIVPDRINGYQLMEGRVLPGPQSRNTATKDARIARKVREERQAIDEAEKAEVEVRRLAVVLARRRAKVTAAARREHALGSPRKVLGKVNGSQVK
jgi:hypothetical protein